MQKLANFTDNVHVSQRKRGGLQGREGRRVPSGAPRGGRPAAGAGAVRRRRAQGGVVVDLNFAF